MKTAISIPDDIYARAARFAARTNKTRSRLFADAVREYLAHHAPDEITRAMNAACRDVKDSNDSNDSKYPFVTSASRRMLERQEW